MSPRLIKAGAILWIGLIKQVRILLIPIVCPALLINGNANFSLFSKAIMAEEGQTGRHWNANLRQVIPLDMWRCSSICVFAWMCFRDWFKLYFFPPFHERLFPWSASFSTLFCVTWNTHETPFSPQICIALPYFPSKFRIGHVICMKGGQRRSPLSPYHLLACLLNQRTCLTPVLFHWQSSMMFIQ